MQMFEADSRIMGISHETRHDDIEQLSTDTGNVAMEPENDAEPEEADEAPR